MTGETYPAPPAGWTCFHCGETFTTPGAAQDHFGRTPLQQPGCQIKAGDERGLLMALRRAEDELARYHAEDSDMDRALGSMRARHTVELREAEERGYERGLADGQQLKSGTEPAPSETAVQLSKLKNLDKTWTAKR